MASLFSPVSTEDQFADEAEELAFQRGQFAATNEMIKTSMSSAQKTLLFLFPLFRQAPFGFTMSLRQAGLRSCGI